jgi:hypothetical protein
MPRWFTLRGRDETSLHRRSVSNGAAPRQHSASALPHPGGIRLSRRGMPLPLVRRNCYCCAPGAQCPRGAPRWTESPGAWAGLATPADSIRHWPASVAVPPGGAARPSAFGRPSAATGEGRLAVSGERAPRFRRINTPQRRNKPPHRATAIPDRVGRWHRSGRLDVTSVLSRYTLEIAKLVENPLRLQSYREPFRRMDTG